MSVQVRRRRESAAFLSTFVGAQGELLVDTTNNRVQVHDGATPGGWPAARLADIIGRTAVADAAYAALVTDRTIAVTSLTAARTITLPAAVAYPTGTQLLIVDESGACSAANTITLARAGTDTINGAASVTIATPYGYLALESNGAGKWTLVDQTPSASGSGASRTPVSDANYTVLTTDRLVTYTSITAPRTVTLPASNAYPTGLQLFVVDESGACSTTNVITIARAGSDTINGAASVVVTTAYGYIALESNGAGKWTLIDQAVSSGTPRTPVADASYTALATDRLIGYTALTAARTVTLPAAAAYPVGTRLLVLDESGSASATLTITLARAGSDTIDGATSATISTGYGYLSVQSNGASRWTIVDQATVPTSALIGTIATGQFPASGVTAGSYGGASSSLTATVDATGRATALAAQTIAIAINQINNLGAGVASALAATASGTGGIALSSGAALTSSTLSSPTLNGGSIGATTPGTGAFTTLSTTGAATFGGAISAPSITGLTTPLSVAQGGTGASTGAGAAAALGITGRTAIGDASTTGTAASRTIAYTAITAARTVTLPAASSFPTGTPLTIVDESGACSGTNTITLAANGSDKINGTASFVLSMPYGYVAIESNGVGAWTIIDQSTAGMGQQAPGSVAITGGSINSTPLGQSTPAPVAATNLSATGTVSLPPNSLTLANEAQAPAGTLRGNPGASTANVSDNQLTAYLDAAFGTAQGQVLFRGPSGWSALVPGASGYVFTSNGAGASPSYQAPGTATAPPRSNIRQTVQGGPQASGAPSFLPATSASLSLTAQSIATGANALTVAAAQGYNATGQNDVITQITSNPTWSSLAASATVYLYINAASGATGSTTLQPIYQFGGTISTTSGQFTFDYQAMVGYLGNGSTAVATPLVFVGEAVTSASAVTSTVAYAYNGRAVLTQTSLSLSTRYSLNHNIGVKDVIVAGSLENVTAELGWVPGDRVIGMNGNNAGSGSQNYSTFFGSTNKLVYIVTGNNAIGVITTTGTLSVFTTANWKAVAIVTRGW